MARLMAEQLELDFFALLPEKTEEAPSVRSPVSRVSKPAVKMPETSERVQFNRDGSRKLNDFGEDLDNQRKGKVRVNRQSNQFLYDEQSELEKRLSREPLDSVWPKDSIIELQKINPKAAACLWLVRGTMSGRKPAQSSPRYQGYLKTALTAIGLHRQVLFGEDAPEVGDVRAFDRFYGIGKESYEVLSLADGKFWPYLRMGVFRNAKALPTANDWKLSDGSDINDYPFQIAVGFNENNAKEKHPLCFLDEDGERIPYIAVVVGSQIIFSTDGNHMVASYALF